ncbi:hypothetical protein JCM11491_004781 [Sporobolomyces phaffii]
MSAHPLDHDASFYKSEEELGNLSNAERVAYWKEEDARVTSRNKSDFLGSLNHFVARFTGADARIVSDWNKELLRRLEPSPKWNPYSSENFKKLEQQLLDLKRSELDGRGPSLVSLTAYCLVPPWGQIERQHRGPAENDEIQFLADRDSPGSESTVATERLNLLERMIDDIAARSRRPVAGDYKHVISAIELYTDWNLYHSPQWYKIRNEFFEILHVHAVFPSNFTKLDEYQSTAIIKRLGTMSPPKTFRSLEHRRIGLRQAAMRPDVVTVGHARDGGLYMNE